METVLVQKQAIVELVQLKEKFDALVESLELLSDPEFMKSYKKSKEQVQKREFVDWNEL